MYTVGAGTWTRRVGPGALTGGKRAGRDPRRRGRAHGDGGKAEGGALHFEWYLYR